MIVTVFSIIECSWQGCSANLTDLCLESSFSKPFKAVFRVSVVEIGKNKTKENKQTGRKLKEKHGDLQR